MSPAIGHGHGKLILAGEHAVVYGHPALAMAVDRGFTTTLTPEPGPLQLPVEDPRLRAVVQDALPEGGYKVQIESTLPLGRGMGSSAALAVSLVRAVASARGEQLDPAVEWERVFAIEQRFHGTPSGVDQAVSARGGVVRFRRGPPPEITALPHPDWEVVVLDSGKAGDTRTMVDKVRALRPAIDPILSAIGALVDQAQAVLTAPRELGPLLTENHRLLQQIGVSTPTLDTLVDLALSAGAHGAKLSGAGGGGVVLALVGDPAPILTAARERGISAFCCRAAPSDPELP